MRIPHEVAHALPAAVIRGVRDSCGYCVNDPETNQQWGAWALAILKRLARLPSDVWALPIDWPHHADELDRALNVRAPRRTASAERKAFKDIAGLLDRAAAALRRPGECDPYVDATIGMIRDFGAPPTTRKMSRADFSGPRGPKLSELLRAYARMYEGTASGAHVVVGFCELAHIPSGLIANPHAWRTTKQTGKNAAAAEAFERVTALLCDLTGTPHNDLRARLVRAYHPDVTDDEMEGFARAARRRRTVANGKARRK